METLAVSKITSQNQITIPKNIQKLLKIKEGDNIIFKQYDDGGEIIVRSAKD